MVSKASNASVAADDNHGDYYDLDHSLTDREVSTDYVAQEISVTMVRHYYHLSPTKLVSNFTAISLVASQGNLSSLRVLEGVNPLMEKINSALSHAAASKRTHLSNFGVVVQL